MVASQSSAARDVGSTSASGSATTWAAAYAIRLLGRPGGSSKGTNRPSAYGASEPSPCGSRTCSVIWSLLFLRSRSNGFSRCPLTSGQREKPFDRDLKKRRDQMTEQVLLPQGDGSLAPYALGRFVPLDEPPGRPKSRIAYAAAHVVADPLADVDPTSRAALDWEATMAYRRYLWSLGFSLAEAMDTAQRGMGLNWETTKELIRRSVAEARSH